MTKNSFWLIFLLTVTSLYSLQTGVLAQTGSTFSFDKAFYTGLDDTVTVTINDPGQNMDSSVVEWIYADVICLTHQALTLGLEETAPDSGLFRQTFGFSADELLPDKLRIINKGTVSSYFYVFYRSSAGNKTSPQISFELATTAAPNPAYIAFDNRVPGEASITGLAGAVQPGAVVEARADSQLTSPLLGERVTADADGAFYLIFNNSQACQQVYLFAALPFHKTSQPVALNISQLTPQPDLNKITFDQSILAESRISGENGAAWPGAKLALYADQRLKGLLATAYAAEDGSFRIEFDNSSLVLSTVYLTATAVIGGQRQLASPPVAVEAVIFDTAPPEVTVAGVVEGRTRGPVVPQITAWDVNGAQMEIKLNGSVFVTGTEIVADGDYELWVESWDRAGNRTVIIKKFSLDNTGPEARFLTPQGFTFPGPSVEMHFDAPLTADLGYFLITLDEGEWQKAGNSGSYTLEGVSYGTHVVRLKAVDDLGNVGPEVSLQILREAPQPAGEPEKPEESEPLEEQKQEKSKDSRKAVRIQEPVEGAEYRLSQGVLYLIPDGQTEQLKLEPGIVQLLSQKQAKMIEVDLNGYNREVLVLQVSAQVIAALTASGVEATLRLGQELLTIPVGQLDLQQANAQTLFLALELSNNRLPSWLVFSSGRAPFMPAAFNLWC
ncbi:hypothetical protein [Zhaonella formicivorans]|uniref:hypothetical protein n=1 Tax=Zhaonella formicivorans TaxID=2528593 RepID=UPI0010F13F05|nr:hypothetical protein [Zhaonella formicivorans]